MVDRSRVPKSLTIIRAHLKNDKNQTVLNPVSLACESVKRINPSFLSQVSVTLHLSSDNPDDTIGPCQLAFASSCLIRDTISSIRKQQLLRRLIKEALQHTHLTSLRRDVPFKFFSLLGYSRNETRTDSFLCHSALIG